MWGEKEVDSSFKGASEKSGGILIMWKIRVINLIYSFMSDGFVGLSALWKNRQIYLVNIYSSCLLQKKIALWNHLALCKSNFQVGERCIAGDFNANQIEEKR